MRRLFAAAFLPVLLANAGFSQEPETTKNWPAFRGADARGIGYGKTLPLTWDTETNVDWKLDIKGRGWSSPIVWNGQVVLTSVETEGKYEEPKKGLYFGGERGVPPKDKHTWKVLSFDLATGKPNWERTVHAGAPEGTIHIKNSFGSETAVTDGERIYAYFGNVGIYCLDMTGEVLWEKRFEAKKTRLAWGTAASPALHNGRLYLVNDNEEESWLMALDAKTGDEIWKVARKEKSNWSTPYVWENKLRTEIITPGSQLSRAYDTDGKLLYEFGGASTITIATPYSYDGLLYVTSGYVGDRRKPIFAIRPGAEGDISLGKDETSNEFIAWCNKTAAPYNPSTIVYEGLLYVLHDRGFLVCYDAKTGEEVYGKKRLRNSGSGFTSSPWAYNGHIFCINENGKTFVIKAGREYKLVGTNQLEDDDMGMATPAIADGKLVLRTRHRLYSLSQE